MEHNQWLLSRGFSATPTVKELMKAERESEVGAEVIADTPRRYEPVAIEPVAPFAPGDRVRAVYESDDEPYEATVVAAHGDERGGFVIDLRYYNGVEWHRAPCDAVREVLRRSAIDAVQSGPVDSRSSSSDHCFKTPQPRASRIPPLTARAHQARTSADELRARAESRALSPDIQWRGPAPFKLNDMDAATAGVSPLPDTHDAIKRTQQLETAATVALESAHRALGECQPHRLRGRPEICCPDDGFGPRGCMHRRVHNALLAAKAVAADRRDRKRAFLAEAREVDRELEASLQTWIREADKSVEALHAVLGSIMHTVHGDERNLAGLPRP